MGLNIDRESDMSVYVRESFETRSGLPIHKAARELVRKYSSTKTVLDLGCSDLVTTKQLADEGFTVIGVDFDISALNHAKPVPPSATMLNADISRLPLKDGNSIDTVVSLETFEHLPFPETVNTLKTLPRICGEDFTAIISMPIISGKSVPCIREFVGMTLSGRRPDTGLFDKTHQIMTDRTGHKKIFEMANLLPVEEYVTNSYTGISGVWNFDPTPIHRNNGIPAVLFRKFLTAVPKVFYPLDEGKQQELFNTLVGFSGLYVLKPRDLH